MPHDSAQVLNRTELFASLDDSDIGALSCVAMRRNFATRDKLFTEGDVCRSRRIIKLKPVGLVVRIMDLVAQNLRRTMAEDCLYPTVTRGISLGCPLSPVMAAIYLELLDRRMDATGLTTPVSWTAG